MAETFFRDLLFFSRFFARDFSSQLCWWRCLLKCLGRDVFSNIFWWSFLFTDFEVQISPQFCSVEVFLTTCFAEISLHNFVGQRVVRLRFVAGLSFELVW